MTSESPTHPDAPRAGGETPDAIEIGGRRFTRNVAFTAEYPNQRWLRLAADGTYRYAGADEWLDRIDALQHEVAELRASLLERHRDGERERFEARVGRMTLAGELRVHRASVTPGHFVARHVPSSIDACELSAELAIRAVLRELDAAMSASPDPERASK